MKAIQLFATDIFDPELEAHYALRTAFRDITTQPHWHDFYEVFLISRGRIVHLVNGQNMSLEAGAFVFMRTTDTHYYQHEGEADCELINLAFPSGLFDSLLAYLGTTFDGGKLLGAENPPTLNLGKSDLDAVRHQLGSYQQVAVGDKARSRLVLRTVLADLMVRFVGGGDNRQSDLPTWLVEVFEAMRDPENLAAGVGRMQAIAACSHEHLCRMFKRYLDVTPTQYINDLRLDYAASLLSHSDLAVVDIALEVGFDGLSYFYRRFKGRFGQTPRDYRRGHRRLSPIDPL